MEVKFIFQGVVTITNKIKIALGNNKKVIGIMVSQIRNPVIVLMAEKAGFDFIIFDMEHGSYTYETIENLLVCCKNTSIVPIVRIPEIKKECILKPLEAGAEGILAPMVETAEEAKQLVHYTKYFPEGNRGFSSRRAHNKFQKSTKKQHALTSNKKIIVMLQIETLKAVNNIGSILSVKGIDMAFIGPSDLSFSLENNNNNNKEKLNLDNTIENIIKYCNNNNIASGMHTYNSEDAKKWINKGLSLVSCTTDINAILTSFDKSISDFDDFK